MIGQAAGIALCLLALWWVGRDVDLELLATTLGEVALLPIVLAVLLNLAGQLLRAAGWGVLLGRRHRVPAPRLVRHEFAAQAATALTPEGSGEALRLWWLSREGVPTATTTAIIAARKLMSSLGLVPFIAALPWVTDLPSLVRLAGRRLYGRPHRRARHPRHRAPSATARRAPGGHVAVRRFVTRMLDGLEPLRDGRVLAASLAIACATKATDVGAAWLICASLDLPVTQAAAVLPLLLVEVSTVLPSAPAQLGSFEVASATALRVLGVPDTSSVAFAVLLHAQQVLPQIAVGALPLLAGTRWRRPELSFGKEP